MNIYLFLLILNLILSAIYILFTKSNQKRIFGLFFIMVPYIGFAIYYLPLLLFRITKKHNIYDKTNVVLHIEQSELIRKPILSEELNIISIDAAMSSCSAQEKRALLLNVLKNDIVKNAKIIKNALTDSDSETSHYAASATLETYKKLKAGIQELENKLTHNPHDITLLRELLDIYHECLDSGVLNKRDYSLFSSKYAKLVEECIKNSPTILLCDDYINQADCYLQLSQNYDALNAVDIAIAKFNTESAYLKGLEIHHKMKNKKKFDELYAIFINSNIAFSNKAVELIRFWNKRCP